MSFFRNLVEELKDEDTVIAADGSGSAEFGGFIDTGSYILNAVLSGSLYGGIPDNKITAFAESPLLVRLFSFLGSSSLSSIETQTEELSTTTPKRRSRKQ